MTKTELFVLEANFFNAVFHHDVNFTKRVRALYAWPIIRKLRPTIISPVKIKVIYCQS